ncbi:MAG: HAD family hydrolase [Lentisphaerota bacterium]
MIQKHDLKNIALIAFDADDTLWDNEPKYRSAEKSFVKILSRYISEDIIPNELLKIEIKNLPICGYGTKSFCMSMMETAMKITDFKITTEELYQIYNLAKNLLKHPVLVYDGVAETLEAISKKYPLALITKGDTLEQERKLFSSELMDKFNFIEIVHEKDEKTYSKLIAKFKIKPEQFLMIGNSPKSDILPILKIGGHAIYIPSDVLWSHETIDETQLSSFEKYDKVNKFTDLLKIF